MGRPGKSGPAWAVACLLGLALLTPRLGAAMDPDPEAGRPAATAAVVKLVATLDENRKAGLGLTGATAQNLTLGPPMSAYTISLADLTKGGQGAWGGLFTKTGTAFFPVRVEGGDQAAVWLVGSETGWEVASLGDSAFAKGVARAKRDIAPALAGLGLHDPYETRLLDLDWAACRLLAVLVRDRLFLWPLPSASALLRLKPGLYPVDKVSPLLTGRSAR